MTSLRVDSTLSGARILSAAISIAFLLLLFSCNRVTERNDTWKIVFVNDKDGHDITGGRDNLISAIRLGSDVKVGWGVKGTSHTIEHLSIPIWLAVLDEREVIAHLDPQLLSQIDWEEPDASYSDSLKYNEEWRVVLSTRGTFDAIIYDRRSGKEIRKMPQHHRMTWYVRGDPSGGEAIPLFGESL